MRMRRILPFVLAGLAATNVSAAAKSADARTALLGAWHGQSICTGARAACRNEVVVYHVTAARKRDVVTIAMNKIVNGAEEEMGSMDFAIDFAAHQLSGSFDNGRVATRWVFHWTGDEMRGTAVMLPDGRKSATSSCIAEHFFAETKRAPLAGSPSFTSCES